jgi:hypothetical protein
MIVMGLGLGVAFPLYTLAVQNAFPIQRVGVVTAAVQFFRSIGSTVGVAILGTVVNNQFHSQFPGELRKALSALPIPGGPGGTPGGGTGGGSPIDQLIAGLSNVNPQALVSPEGLAQLKAQLIQMGTPEAFVNPLLNAITTAMKPALFGGIHEAFLIGTILVGIGFITTIFLKEIPLRKSNRGPAPGAGMAEGGGENFAFEAEEAGREMAASGMPATEIPAEEEPELVER